MLLADNGAVAPSHGRHRVLVYRGEGASPRLLKATTQALQSALPGSYEVRAAQQLQQQRLTNLLLTTLTCSGPTSGPQVRALSCEELLKGAWTASASLLVMPGGADLPYCAALNGRGNRLIAGAATGMGRGLLLAAAPAAQHADTDCRLHTHRLRASGRGVPRLVCWRLLRVQPSAV